MQVGLRADKKTLILEEINIYLRKLINKYLIKKIFLKKYSI
jgi:hypothetical protein